jgi:hypothetical protein
MQFPGAVFLFSCNFAGFLASCRFSPNNQTDEEIIEFERRRKPYGET